MCGQDSVKRQGIERALLSAAYRHSKMGSLAGAVLTAAGGFLLLGSFFYGPALQTHFPDPAWLEGQPALWIERDLLGENQGTE